GHDSTTSWAETPGCAASSGSTAGRPASAPSSADESTDTALQCRLPSRKLRITGGPPPADSLVPKRLTTPRGQGSVFDRVTPRSGPRPEPSPGGGIGRRASLRC